MKETRWSTFAVSFSVQSEKTHASKKSGGDRINTSIAINSHKKVKYVPKQNQQYL